MKATKHQEISESCFRWCHFSWSKF